MHTHHTSDHHTAIAPKHPARLFAYSALQRVSIALVPIALVWLITGWALS